MAARRLEYLSIVLCNLSLCCVLHLCQMMVHRLILATSILAASANPVHAAIENGWPIDWGITCVMRNLPGYPYSTHAATSLAKLSPKFQWLGFLRKPSTVVDRRVTTLGPHDYPSKRMFFSVGTLNALEVCLSDWTITNASHSYSRGMVIRLIGATFVLATTKLMCAIPFVSVARI